MKWIASKEQTLIRTVPYSELLPFIGGPTKRIRVGQRQRARTCMKLSRLKLFRQNNKCEACGKLGTYWGLNYSTQYGYVWNLYSADGEVFNSDHILALSNGGADSLNNMQTLCYSCNNAKGDKPCFCSIKPDTYGKIRWK